MSQFVFEQGKIDLRKKTEVHRLILFVLPFPPSSLSDRATSDNARRMGTEHVRWQNQLLFILILLRESAPPPWITLSVYLALDKYTVKTVFELNA